MFSVKQLEKFTCLKIFSSDSKDLPRFSHGLFIYKKKKNRTRWYIKSVNVQEAIMEVIAQELFRLILPSHPKTRLVEEELTSNSVYYYVASKAVSINPFFFSKDNYYEKFLKGEVSGLGAVQIVSLWLNEVDFKVGNVVVKEGGDVIKLDGGLCFAGLQDNISYDGQARFAILASDLESLPTLHSYTPYHWLDLIYHEEQEQGSEPKRIINLNSQLLKLSSLEKFQREINQTILRIIVLPEPLIRYFAYCYAPRGIADPLINVILERQEQLKTAAYQTKSFNAYRERKEALTDLIDYVVYLKMFKTMGHSFLLTDVQKDININVAELIFERFVKNYTPVLRFYQLAEPYLAPNSFLALKAIIDEYLIAPTLAKQQVLCQSLQDTKKALKTFKPGKDNSLMLNFFINKLIEDVGELKKIVPISAPRKITKVTPTTTIINNRATLFQNKKVVYPANVSEAADNSNVGSDPFNASDIHLHKRQ